MSTNYINQITDTAGTTHDIMEGVTTRIFRGTCSTAAATAQKDVTLDDSTGFSLTYGVRVAVTFVNGNSAENPTLKVGSSNAAGILYYDSASSVHTGGGTAYSAWGPYETIIFTYMTSGGWVHTPSGWFSSLIYNSIPSAADATPLVDGTAAIGTSTDYAREDHVHPTDTSRQAAIGNISGVLKGNGSGGIVAATAGTDYQAPLTTENVSEISIDSSPTSSSSNLVTSGGVFTAINNKVNRTTAVNAADTNYTTIMARGIKLLDATTYDAVTDWSSQLVSGAVALKYE